MKKIILIPIMMLLLTSIVLATSIIREYSGNTVKYIVDNPPSGSWGVLVEDNVIGCTPNKIAVGWLSPDTEYSTTVTGSNCQFDGTYQFSTSSGIQPETKIGNEIGISGETKFNWMWILLIVGGFLVLSILFKKK